MPAQRLCATRLLRCAPWELRDNESEERLRERAEGVRVAYVAATRARDLLVVPAVGDRGTGRLAQSVEQSHLPSA